MSKFEGQSNKLEQAGIEKKMELLDKKIDTLEKLVDSTEDEAKKLEIMEKLEAAYEAKAKEQVKTEEGQAELKEEVQEAVKEAKQPGKLDKLKLQIGAGTLAALAALGGGMAIMGGEKTPENLVNTYGDNEQTEVVEDMKDFKRGEISYEKMSDGLLLNNYLLTQIDYFKESAKSSDNIAKKEAMQKAYERLEPMTKYYNEDYFQQLTAEVEKMKYTGVSGEEQGRYLAEAFPSTLPEELKYSQLGRDMQADVTGMVIGVMENKNYVIERIYEMKGEIEN